MTAAVEFDSEAITHNRRSYGEPAMRCAATASAIVILLMLAALLVVLFAAAVPSMRRFGMEFLTTSAWRPNSLPVLKMDARGKPIRDRRTGMKVVDHYDPPRFGALAPVTGTAQTALIALIFAVPLSLGSALFLVRIAPLWLIMPVSFLIEFLAAIPSIAYGLWGMFVLGPWMGGPARWDRVAGLVPMPAGIESRLSGFFMRISGLHWLAEQQIGGKTVPIPTTGRDILVAGIVLGIMIIPIITAISRDVLRSVPPAQIEGTIALGATWWQSCREMLKYSRSALFGAIILGFARASGETMAVLMVMGSAATIAASPFTAGTTMASTLAGEFPEAATNDLHRGALMELALILLIMSLAFNIIARYLVVGKSARTSAAH
ncbi:MAG: phosphate ABC transporter permease subunit PstC [Tepidisphaeraceae bacterium]